MCTGQGIDLKKQRERQAHHGNPRNSQFYSGACLKPLCPGQVSGLRAGLAAEPAVVLVAAVLVLNHLLSDMRYKINHDMYLVDTD